VEIEKSRTQMKKEAAVLKQMGAKLTALSQDQLRHMDLPTELMTAIEAFWEMKSHGARRRQLQYIGSVMREVDATVIEQGLLEIAQGASLQARAFHRLESWRDRLVDGDDDLMQTILTEHPHADRQRLGQLVRSARKEKGKNAPPKSARNLFRHLKEITET
jgi:ribosome-associated protein